MMNIIGMLLCNPGYSQPVPQAVSVARVRSSSRYLNYMLGNDGKPRAVVTLDQRTVITYAHGEHAQLQEGKTVQVCELTGKVVSHKCAVLAALPVTFGISISSVELQLQDT